ncbi:DNA polymerase III subunit chi [Thalassocella blandensis]|nr:DNA polymerase III subunit chi [Thalassocella blandensis]
MTQIDFYVLEIANSLEAQRDFACRLVDKAMQQGNQILIATENASHSQAIDDQLWRFRPESFLPHAIAGSAEAADTPIVISHNENDVEHHDVLINLRHSVPKQFSRFERLVEIVVQQAEILDLSRKNFAFYKKRGYPINTHKLKM